jgi:hypothetical protein
MECCHLFMLSVRKNLVKKEADHIVHFLSHKLIFMW